MSKEELKHKIFVAINSAKEPIDCEKIAKEVTVGWGTALRYSLELFAQGKIQGVKTSKSWVFWVGNLSPMGNIEKLSVQTRQQATEKTTKTGATTNEPN